MNIVSAIVDKQHASLPWRRVLRIVIGRMKGGKAAYKRLNRETRRQIVSEVYKRQQANWRLYVAVVTGDLSLMEE